jgi:tellurite resistance protein
MKHPVPTPAEASAHALAMMVAANGRVDERELVMLDQLQAFGRLGVTRNRFVEIARSCVADVGAHLCDRSWLSVEHMSYIDALLDAVPGTEARTLVCRLAAAVVTADGRVTHDERLVYDHALARWRINPSDVTKAILQDRVP